VSDRFRPLGAERLAAWIAAELDGAGSVFGIPRELWFTPSTTDRFAFDLRGARLETPIGVAAGPHTQLAQNIVIAWLCGARVIELKTVQTLDRIEVPKPCIDMQDEGYNIEWSQELTVRQSLHEYLMAWVLIHTLHARFGFAGASPGVLFDLSVGYDIDGIRQPNMRWFLEHTADAGEELDRCVTAISHSFPEVFDLDIPTKIADSVTLSTLHGCPPEEIGAIVEHLLDSWGLHTAVKLNPTLLGYELVRDILIEDLGWAHVEPYRGAFDSDIGYHDAIALITRLKTFGDQRGLDFSIKLCNTLPVVNRREEFHDGEATAYLSGRPLHALAVELARRVTDDTQDEIAISFAGGADAFNTPALLAAGLRPVTICSDLLRPGGYLRLRQYLEEIDAALDRNKASDLDQLIIKCAGEFEHTFEAAQHNLQTYADSLRSDPELARGSYRRDHTKSGRTLGFFDCIEAPCTDVCSINQQVPAYMRSVAAGDVDGAATIIALDNPLPSILGRACHHPCEPVCLRTHIDQPVAIREIKRFAMDNGSPRIRPRPSSTEKPRRVAIVGAGPCGLAASAELARGGSRVVLFEARDEGGGMVSATIPGYRAPATAVRRDLDSISALGVEVRFGISIGRDRTLDELLNDGFDDIVVAVGAQRGLRLGIDGEESDGVLDGLDFLRKVRRGGSGKIGRRIAVIGGGDVAVDCARSARRLSGGEVKILYRRTVDQMPAHPEEIRDLLAEGISIRELVAPRRVVAEDGRLRSVECTVMTLGKPDASGRPRPVEVSGGDIRLEFDTLIVAIGQQADLGVFKGMQVTCSPSGYLEVDAETLETSISRVYAGGDLRDPGPSNIVDACGDGQRIARAILKSNRPEHLPHPSPPRNRAGLLARRAHRLSRVETPRKPGVNLSGFDEVIDTLTADAAAREAARCLDCDILCSTCDGVCPNRAIVTYELYPSITRLGFSAGQTPQVAVIADLCNECGNCATFCPTVGRPWQDKPRLYFDRGDFEAEKDNAFMFLRINGLPGIQGRFHGETHQLVMGGDPAKQAIESAPYAGEVSMKPSIIMYTLLHGLTESMPHLPIPEAEPGWLIHPDDAL
jgi:putative selenate reductase